MQPGADVFPPEVNSTDPANDNLINVVFSEDVTETAATVVGNYSLNNGVTIESIQIHSFPDNIVFLTGSKMGTADYTLNIYNVEVLAGNKMVNVQTDFYYESTGIHELDGVSSISICPNPSESIITINYLYVNIDQIQLEIFDFNGIKVYQEIM